MTEADSMIALEDAFAIMEKVYSKSVIKKVKVPSATATGLFLLQDVFSKLDMPPFDKSAMDGYAVRAGEEKKQYNVLGTVKAGDSPTAGKLKPGGAMKIMTGAPVPRDAGKVVMKEYCQEDGGIVTIFDHGSKTNICLKGEDLKKGEIVLQKHRLLDEIDIANAVSCGVDKLEVAQQLTVAVISTGDELVSSFGLLKPGKIMNSNGPLLSAICQRYGFKVNSVVTAKDNINALTKAVKEALATADIVVLSGGVSEGEFDHVPDVLSSLGMDIHFSRVAIKPGKPVTFATCENKAVVGLPGNPVSVYVTFHVFVLKLAALMSGAGMGNMRKSKARMGEKYSRSKTTRREYVLCKLNSVGDIQPIESHGPAHLSALVEADGLFVVHRGTKEIAEGEHVLFVPTRLGVL